MSELQNVTIQKQAQEISDDNVTEVLLSPAQQKWIDFCAVGGLVVGDDSSLKQMTISEFAPQLGVTRKTLYEWKKSIPNFIEKVNKRRVELGGSPARIAKVYNGLFLKASAGNPEAAKLWLQKFDGWQPPKQDVAVEHNLGLADLVTRKKLEHDRKKIDAERTDREA